MKRPWDILFAIFITLLAAGVLYLVTRQPLGAPVQLLPLPTPLPLVIHVTGAVIEPGVYALERGARVQDAIFAAGGFAQGADLKGINLAAPVEDGQQLTIPWLPATPTAPPASSNLPTPTRAAASAATDMPAGESAGTGLININTATLEALDTLPGIGPVIAQRIINHRDANGPFQSIEAIQDVEGIGPATYARLKNLITVGP